jgi:hypothetical protein
VTTPPTDNNRIFNMQRYPRPADADYYSAQMVEENLPPANTRDPNNYVTRDSAQTGATPEWIVFDPVANTTSHLSNVIVSGKIIETGDIDATSIVVENSITSLYQQNGILVSGCIPLSQVKDGTTDPSVWLFRRDLYDSSNFPITLFRGQAYCLWLPIFRRGLIQSSAIAAQPTLAQLFPNFRLLRHARRATTGSNVNAALFGNTFPYVQGGSIRTWSSYRIQSTGSTGIVNWYMIPSLRATFGYVARVFATIHPALRVP